MIAIGLFLCVLALLVIGLLFFIAWDACEYDRRLFALEITAKKQAEEIADLRVRLDGPFAESCPESEVTP